MVTLQEAKNHLRVTHESEDELIEQNLNAAVDFVNKSCFINMAELTPIPNALKQAVLLLMADYYENREAHIFKNLTTNKAVENTLRLYRAGKI